MKPLISIIIPIYNGEKYLDECIQSVIKYPKNDIEIILVNDGSTDSSLKICEKYKTIDQRIKILSTINKGVSHARNKGIEVANGNWLMFLDCDDYLFENVISKLIDMIHEDDEEISAYYDEHDNEIKNEVVLSNDVIKMLLNPWNHQLFPDYYKMKDSLLFSTWAKLFRKDIIINNNLRFDEKLRLSEDVLFHLNYLKCIKQVRITNLSVLHYRVNEESVTNIFKDYYVDQRIYLSKLLYNESIDTNIYLTTLLLQLLLQVASIKDSEKRKTLEIKIINFISKFNIFKLIPTNIKLSNGTYQNLMYKITSILLKKEYYKLTLFIFHIYSRLKGGN